MPYPGIDDAETVAKIDSCVEQVMATGKDKESAIAICIASVTQEQTMNPIQLLWKQITDLFKPHLEPQAAEATNRMVIRQADGRYRWFGVAATAVLNHDMMIDSRKLFDSFIAYVRATGEYPDYDVMHLGEACVIGKTDFIVRDEAVYFASGTFNEDEFSQAAARAMEKDPGYWGHSIAFIAGDPSELRIWDMSIPVFESGINQFISVVPRSRAASLFTDVTVQQRSKDMNEEQFAELVKLVGPELAAKKRDELAQLNRTITEAGLIQRTATTPADATPPAVETPVPPVTATPPVVEAQPATAPAPKVEERAEPTMSDVMGAITAMQQTMQAIADTLAGVQTETKETKERLAAIEQPVNERIQQALDDAPSSPGSPIVRPRVERAIGTTQVDPTDTLGKLAAQKANRK